MCIKSNSKKMFTLLVGVSSAFYSYSQTWSDVGGGVNNTAGVFALSNYNGKLIVSGGFDSVGAVKISANYVASWDGNNWDSLGGGLQTGFHIVLLNSIMSCMWQVIF